MVVLRGVYTPYVSKRQDERYRLVCPAYVHRIMDGEAVQAHIASGGLREIKSSIR